jgi:hypothetical protein
VDVAAKPSLGPVEKRLVAFFAVVAVACLVLGQLGVLCWPPATYYNQGWGTGVVGPGGGELVKRRLYLVGVAVGVVGIVAVVVRRRVAALRSPSGERLASIVAATWVVLAIGAVVVGLAPIVDVGLHQSMLMRGPNKQPPPELQTVPGRSVEIAETVVAEVRRGLRERRGSFTTPAGTRREFFILRGPVLNEPDAWPIDYERARALAGCILLPRDDDEDKDEVVSLAPGPAFDTSPAALDRGSDKQLRCDNPLQDISRDPMKGVSIVTRGFALGGPGAYSYAVSLRRFRPFLHGRSRSLVARPVPPTDELYEARVFILRQSEGKEYVSHEVAVLVGP